MTARRLAALAVALLPGLAALAAPEDVRLVALDDYPPYYDALMARTRAAGLRGSEAVAGLSVLDDGVRVMPVKVAVAGKLPQIVGLLAGIHREFPYASRFGRLQIEPGPAGAPAWRMEMMLLSPVRPEGTPAPALTRRLADDRAHGAVFTRLMEALTGRPDVGRWLRAVRLDGGSVFIEGSVPEGTAPERLVQDVIGIPGMVVAEVIGPQEDPETGEDLFLATGRLDYPEEPAGAPAEAAPAAPAPAGEVG
jgi:hypothetical protein